MEFVLFSATRFKILHEFHYSYALLKSSINLLEIRLPQARIPCCFFLVASSMKSRIYSPDAHDTCFLRNPTTYLWNCRVSTLGSSYVALKKFSFWIYFPQPLVSYTFENPSALSCLVQAACEYINIKLSRLYSPWYVFHKFAPSSTHIRWMYFSQFLQEILSLTTRCLNFHIYRLFWN